MATNLVLKPANWFEKYIGNNEYMIHFTVMNTEYRILHDKFHRFVAYSREDADYELSIGTFETSEEAQNAVLDRCLEDVESLLAGEFTEEVSVSWESRVLYKSVGA